jgi:hypothetical protein
MEDHDLNVSEAWERVKLDMTRMLGGGVPTAPGPQPSLFGAEPRAVMQASISLEAPTGQSTSPRAGVPTVAAQPIPVEAQPTSAQPTSEAAVPLRGEALRTMALAQKATDLHPVAKLLAEAGPEDPMLERLQPERAAARQQVEQLALQFPKTPAGRYPFPADLCRTSIFHVASNNVPRRECDQEIMGQVGANIVVMYSGTELRHDDERVLMQLIQLAQNMPPWSWIEISTIPFARAATGFTRKLGKDDMELVEQSLWRMRKGLVTLTKDRNFIPFNPIRDLLGSGAKRRIQLDPRIVLLLNNSYVLLDDALYHDTRGIERQVFKYLHTNPHEEIYPVKIQTLFELCYGTIEALETAYLKENPGKTDKQARRAIQKKVSDFRSKGLPTALAELMKKDVITDYDKEMYEREDKVSLKKGPIFAQYARREVPAA